jgi:hypothetical protein
VRRVLRRSLTILLPVTLAVLATGCGAVSQRNTVASVDGTELSDDEFEARLLELGADPDSVVPLEPVREEIGAWINEQLAAGVDLAALYDEGPATSGVTCFNAIVVEQQETADDLVAELEGGADFATVFAANNLDQSLAETGGAVPCLGPEEITQNAGTPFVDAGASLSPDEPLATAPLLDTTGAEFGWVVLELRSFADLTEDEVARLPELLDLSDAAAGADVHVDPRYGTFDAETGTVVALG